MRGIILDNVQLELLRNQKFDDISYFNPVEDNNGKWYVSEEEVLQLTNVDFFWLQDLPIEDIEIKVYPDLF